MSFIDRFWAKVNKKGPNGCWIWTAYKYNGYGRFMLHGKVVQAHRLAYRITFGEIPDEIKILHKCDNPSCVNPNHLFKGTQSDNIQDMIQKGRKASCIGEHNGRHKLSENQVNKIRIDIRHYSHKFLALLYGVSLSTIRAIAYHQKWQHLEED